MVSMRKNISENRIMEITEDVVGCKWTLRVISQLRSDCKRPGDLKRAIPGISAKVLNERLSKLVRYELIRKKIYPVTPPKVEYSFTTLGRKFLIILDAIHRITRLK